MSSAFILLAQKYFKKIFPHFQKILLGSILLLSGMIYSSVSFMRKTTRCQFDHVRAKDLTQERFEELMFSSQPLLITGMLNNWPLDRWRWRRLKNRFGRKRFRVGQGPYPTRSEYLDEFINGSGNPGIFQFGNVPTSFTVHSSGEHCEPVYAMVYPFSSPMHPNGKIACSLLGDVKLPPFLSRNVQISHAGVLLGGVGSGIFFHHHADAVNCLLHGTKVWRMKGPGLSNAGEDSDNAIDEKIERLIKVSELASELRWAPRIVNRSAEPELRCVQREGEVVFIPAGYDHAVLNIEEETTAVQMQWDRLHWAQEGVRETLAGFLENHLTMLAEQKDAAVGVAQAD